MDFFNGAKEVRLRGHHKKYLIAEEDEEHVCQGRSGADRAARWSVEFADGGVIRLKSCHGRYLTASNEPFLLRVTGRKVLQTLPRRLDSSVEWEPVREGNQLKLKTRYGNFLRANAGLPPWRNSVTHDVPHRSNHQDWVLWDVDVLDLQPGAPSPATFTPPPPHSVRPSPIRSSSRSSSVRSSTSSREESHSSPPGSPYKTDGRTIYYKIAKDDGRVDDGEGACFIFRGTSVDQLKEKLEEMTEIKDIFVCSPSPLNGKLHPLRLHLPPNKATMNVVVVKASSRAARGFKKPEDEL